MNDTALKAARLTDAMNSGRWACEHYLNWYYNGMAAEAPNVAYDVVSALRQLMSAVKEIYPEHDAAGESLKK